MKLSSFICRKDQHDCVCSNYYSQSRMDPIEHREIHLNMALIGLLFFATTPMSFSSNRIVFSDQPKLSRSLCALLSDQLSNNNWMPEGCPLLFSYRQRQSCLMVYKRVYRSIINNVKTQIVS